MGYVAPIYFAPVCGSDWPGVFGVSFDAMRVASATPTPGGLRVTFSDLAHTYTLLGNSAEHLARLNAARFDAWLEHGGDTPQPETVCALT